MKKALKILKHAALSIIIAIPAYFVVIMLFFLIKYPITQPESPEWADRFVSAVSENLDDLEFLIGELNKDYIIRGNEVEERYIFNNDGDEFSGTLAERYVGTTRVYQIDFNAGEVAIYDDNMRLQPIDLGIDKALFEKLQNCFLRGSAGFELSPERVFIHGNVRYIYSFTGGAPKYVGKKGDARDYEIYKINDDWYYAIPDTDWW
jgi:hypothetical protein